MKFSIRQILASAVGAVIAAVIASSFGVKGTIVGVAIGSAAATMATAFVAQSIERGHEAVKQVVVRAPETSSLLRKLGGTGVNRDTPGSTEASSAPTRVERPTGADGGRTADTIEMESAPAPVGETERLEISAVADAPATERLQATTMPVRPGGRPRRFSWGVIASTAVVVFVLALLFITAVELISGKPLADIFGNAGDGTSVGGVFRSPPAPAPTPTTTTTTTTSSSTSTSTTTTSTTAPAGNTTTTATAPPTSTTTTVGAGATSTTTTVPTSP